MRELPVDAFARKLGEMLKEPDCKVLWFLGAGCSISSGIPAAGGLVNLWMPRLKEQETGSEADWPAWAATKFPDFDANHPAEHYGRVIDALFPLPYERQQEVERLTSEKDPAIGYALLAVLAAHDVYGPRANVVLTTNFDDLVADALYLLTRKKPLVVAHDSLADFVRTSQKTPLVVKVHGDARLAPRNTHAETTTLDDQLAQRLVPLFNDRALVFLGYGGNDESIMRLLESAPKESFPLGIYWVSGSSPSGAVGEWAQNRSASRNDVFHIASSDFDDFFLQLRDVLGLQMPDGSRLVKLFESYKDAMTAKGIAAAGSTEAGKRDRATRARQSLDATTLASKALEIADTDPAQARELFSDALTADPDNQFALGSFANFLSEQNELDDAEQVFVRAITSAPNRASTLGNYAIFLKNKRQDFARAEEMYERAIAADPDHSNNLGNFALFLSGVKKNFSRAEPMYEKAVAADPNNANNVGNYAAFLDGDIDDIPRAEIMYERAIAIDPNHPNNLGNFANFLARIERDPPRVLSLFERAIDADLTSTTRLSNFAKYLGETLGDHRRALDFYKRAIAADPSNGIALGNYIEEILCRSRSAAEKKRAIKLSKEILDRDDIRAKTKLGVAFNLMALTDDQSGKAILKHLLVNGERNVGWNFRPALERVATHTPERGGFLKALADVIAGVTPLDELDKFSDWLSE